MKESNEGTNGLPLPETKDALTPAIPKAGSGLTTGKKEESIYEYLQSASMRRQFDMAVPKGLTAERFVRIAITALRKNPKLTECKRASLLGALMLSAQLGLEPNTPLGHAYLIPYGDECTFQIGYQGLLDLAYRSGIVKSIMVFDRCENDTWQMEYGCFYNIKHIPADNDRGKILGYYGVATLENSAPIFHYMSIAEIEAVRDKYSQKDKYGKFSKAWSTPAQYKKTVIIRLLKFVPKASEKAMDMFGAIQEGAVKGVTADFKPVIDTVEETEQADFEVVDE